MEPYPVLVPGEYFIDAARRCRCGGWIGHGQDKHAEGCKYMSETLEQARARYRLHEAAVAAKLPEASRDDYGDDMESNGRDFQPQGSPGRGAPMPMSPPKPVRQAEKGTYRDEYPADEKPHVELFKRHDGKFGVSVGGQAIDGVFDSPEHAAMVTGYKELKDNEHGPDDMPPMQKSFDGFREGDAEDEMQPQMKEAYGKFAEGIKEECSVRAGADKGKPPMKPEGEKLKEAAGQKFAEGLGKLCNEGEKEDAEAQQGRLEKVKKEIMDDPKKMEKFEKDMRANPFLKGPPVKEATYGKFAEGLSKLCEKKK